ncbi:hypothetical protein D6X86_10615 [Escherichia albertii]|nr:hypothetical protein [Escherichia albertii]
MPDATLVRLIMPTSSILCAGRIRRLRRIRRLCADARCDAGASYHAYEFDTLCRPDKAFTPHPAVVHGCPMRRWRVLSCLRVRYSVWAG